jgi:hypothetical protein
MRQEREEERNSYYIMLDRSHRRSDPSPSSSGEGIDKVNNGDNSIKRATSPDRSSKTDLWQRSHCERLLEQQSISLQAHSLTEQTQEVAANPAAPEEALHRQDEWRQESKEVIKILNEWHNIAEDANEVMKKELYNHLPRHIKSKYEKDVENLHVVHDEYVNGYINKSDFKSEIARFNSVIKEMKELVDPWEKLSSNEPLSDSEIDIIKGKISNAAKIVEWEKIMEVATKIVKKAKSDNYSYIMDAASESGDRSIEKYLWKIASNKENILLIRMRSVYALGQIGNDSTLKELQKMSKDKNLKSESMRLALRSACRAIEHRL